VLALLLPPPARAQDVPPVVQMAPTTERPETSTAIDLQNIVTTAAKGVTTVQEAPAIVTVVTADDMRKWGYRTLQDALTDIPGWNRQPAFALVFETMTVRGQTQSMLFMHDGISLFEPVTDLHSVSRAVPLESIKRVEVVTGPGGVLWGANSFLGIVNVITKDADDVPGIEASAGYGDGVGDQSDLRAYLMTGQSLLGGRLKLFLHGSYQNYVGQEVTERQFITHSAEPQPTGPTLFGNYQTSDPKRSWLYVIDGKATAGPLSAYWQWVDGETRTPTTVNYGAVQQSTPNNLPWGPNMTTDPLGLARDNVFNRWDRYGTLAYRDRFGGARLGVDAKAYIAQMVVDFARIQQSPASLVVPGGVVSSTLAISQRAGVTLDGEVLLPASNRLLFGGEAFREWSDGQDLTFSNPDPARSGTPPGTRNPFAFPCPFDPSGMRYLPSCPIAVVFPSSRVVTAGFLSDQWRLFPTLLLDAGARVQAGAGQFGYDPQVLFSGALVWNFVPSWHLKANFAQGFRSPVFVHINSNAAGFNAAGSPDIRNEQSNAVQGEINARLLRGVRRVRELTLRADYSYSLIDDLITVGTLGRFVNSGRRGIHSAETLAQLFLRGGHEIRFSYTFLRVLDAAEGVVQSVPSHVFTVGALFNLAERVDLVNTLWLASSVLDPNLDAHPNLSRCIPGLPSEPANCGADATITNVVWDRLPAPALWNLGLRWRPSTGLELSAFVYNLLDQHWIAQDAINDPTFEHQPLLGAGRSAFANLRYQY